MEIAREERHPGESQRQLSKSCETGLGRIPARTICIYLGESYTFAIYYRTASRYVRRGVEKFRPRDSVPFVRRFWRPPRQKLRKSERANERVAESGNSVSARKCDVGKFAPVPARINDSCGALRRCRATVTRREKSSCISMIPMKNLSLP